MVPQYHFIRTFAFGNRGQHRLLCCALSTGMQIFLDKFINIRIITIEVIWMLWVDPP
jgi:accessory gene regulator protein AgrB